jgi:peptide/nickel transport system permease protein
VAQVVSEPEGGTPEPGSGYYNEAEGAVVGRSPRQLFWSRFRRDHFAVAGLVVIAFISLLAIFAPIISRDVVHHGKNDIFLFQMTNSEGVPAGPNKQFWFGADNAARDLFVRVLYGARTSLIIALFATGAEMVVGIILGLIAGFYRGKVDTFISRLSDVVLSMPVLLLAIGLVSACGLQKDGCLGGLIKPGLLFISYVIALFSWPYLARIVRGQVLSLREKEFVESARALGASNWRIMTREILPNVMAPIIVYTTLIIPSNILFEAALSFLGIGVPPSTPSWGRMLSDATTWYETAWWMMVFPGVFLLATTLAFNLVGDGMRDALDPRAASMSFRRQHQRRADRKEKERQKQQGQPTPQMVGGSGP